MEVGVPYYYRICSDDYLSKTIFPNLAIRHPAPIFLELWMQASHREIFYVRVQDPLA